MAVVPFLQQLRERQAAGRPLLGDGAMGTLLHARGAAMEACFDDLNRTQPQAVLAAHRDYLVAGAEIIETNTFSANRYKLTEHGLQEQVADINRAGVLLARQAIDQHAASGMGHGEAYVAGAVGPLGLRLKPFGRLEPSEARAAFAEQIAALAAAGADLIVLETFTDHVELLEALAASREAAPHLPIVCHMTFGGDDRTLLGYLPGRIAQDLTAAGADVIGVNCSGGPEQLSRLAQAMHTAAPQALISVMPNAGYPRALNGRVMYTATTEYFADYALTFRALGMCIIGGCCGTTPDHIAAMRRALDDPRRQPQHLPTLEVLAHEETTAHERPTELAHRLASGQFTVTVEMAPPRAYTVHKLISSARMLREAGADLLDVADSPTARMRMSPWAVCHVLQTQVGAETVLHFPTRGRNLLRIQGDLLAAHALGLRNLFIVLGDPTAIGDYPDAHDTYDIAPSALIGLVKHKMNMGQDQAGNTIGQPTSFTVGCALNMGADDLDKEIRLTLKKEELGADFALGQPIFDPAQVQHFHQRYQELAARPFKLPVLMGVMPLYSLKHAQYLNNEVPGLTVPPDILKQLEDAGEAAPRVGVQIAQRLIAQMRDQVQGAYIIPSYGRYELAAEVIESIRVRA